MAAKPLNPGEWDFRSIEDWELLTAVVYEYTRSVPPIFKAIQKWHRAAFRAASLREHEWDESTARVRKALKQRRRLTNADAVEIASNLLDLTEINPLDLTLLHLELRRTLSPALATFGVYRADRIATRFEDLSIPWTALKKRHGESYLKKRCLSFQARICSVSTAWETINSEEILALEPTLRPVDLLIDWSQSKEDISSDFKRWLDDNHPGMTAARRRRPGPKATWAWLKWLAAYRITKSGYKFPEAKKFVGAHLIEHPGRENVADVIPNYAHQAAWDDAVKKAEAALNGDFISMILSDFGILL